MPDQLWPHQTRAIQEVCTAICRGDRRILVTSPTGGGKTAIASELIRVWLEEAKKVILYTNRRLLVDQTSRVMAAAGHVHGVRAAGYADERELLFQVSSIQTEGSRVLRGGRWELHEAELVVVDEAHLQAGPTARKILAAHHEAGASIVGLTATPLDLADLYDVLVVAGTNSELRECGALVPAWHFGCDEPDLRKIGRVALGEDLSESQNRKAMMVPGIFGRVMEWYGKLNPSQTPTLLFAPGVKESVWFAEQFTKAGIRAAHIDGQEVWLDGEFERSTQGERNRVLEAHRDGLIKIVCNRFVLREGVDAPWIEHLILATVLGSLQTYLQTVGRGLRTSPETGKEHLVIQDHGGSWWRHGSANEDREWRLEYTAGMVSGLREERLRSKRCPRCKTALKNGNPKCPKCGFVPGEPLCCPKCKRILMGFKCLGCDYEIPLGVKSRPVIQSDGTLREMVGDIYKPRRVSKAPNGKALWERMFYRSKTEKGQRTFRAAMALFAQENRWSWPDPSWPFMPIEPLDWFRLVKDVPVERLVPK